MAAHRYWRLYINSVVGAGNTYPNIGDVTMSGAGGNLIGTGTAFASATTFGAAADAVDGNATSRWQGGQVLPQWWGYDFSAPVDVTGLTLTASYAAPTNNPLDWSLESSDDGTTWTFVKHYVSGDWIGGQTQTFDTTPIEPGRFWRVLWPAWPGGGAPQPELAEIAMAVTPGGANVLTGGVAYAKEHFSSWTPNLALDGNPSTFYAGLGGSSGTYPQWWAYDLGTGNAKNISEVTLTATIGNPTQLPQDFDLQSSADGIDWLTVKNFGASVFASGQAQAFAVAPAGAFVMVLA
jgi:hypothetical protein